ncbi:kinase-like domain-containing protein [Hypoxylon sp. FL0543]|nr:kinase-like domain-containing protein [Hypoxylon sp. FL0543]
MDEEDVPVISNHLERFFSGDSRFIYREAVGLGSSASAHRVQYVEKLNGHHFVTDFLVKVSPKQGWAAETIKEERTYLKLLRGGMHVVRLIDIPDDPLNKYNFQDEWSFLIMEWLPNGTLAQFVRKARNMGLQRLPNRLLWRFFLCLIRGCCSMAWPKKREDDVLELEIPMEKRQETICHGDLHHGNVVLGDFEMTGEHQLTPILKLIDFGNSSKTEDIVAANKENLFDVGKLMLKLITLNNETFPGPAHNPRKIKHDGQFIETLAHPILPPSHGEPSPFPWHDEWLVDVVALCIVVDSAHQPSLEEFVTWAVQAVNERDAAYYGTPNETDVALMDLCKRTILYAPTVNALTENSSD